MTKFKVGDRVVGTDKCYSHRQGETGTVTELGNDGVWVNWGSWDIQLSDFHQITHYGQTLADLDVRPGDVVECVKTGNQTTVTHFSGGAWFGDGDLPQYPYSGDPVFRIVSRAADEWSLCPDDYVTQDDHECTYHKGVPVAYRVIEVVKDVDKRVRWDGGYLVTGVCSDNATLRGQTRNGKPVGQWVIDMDGEA